MFYTIFTLLFEDMRVFEIIQSKHYMYIFNRDLSRGSLVYIFPLCFLGRKFLINLRRQFRVRKIFSQRQLRAQGFGGFAVLFILCLKLLFRKCVT